MIDAAFKDYTLARSLLIKMAVANEYIADAGFPLPSKKELAQRLQDISRLACALTNQDEQNTQKGIYKKQKIRQDVPKSRVLLALPKQQNNTKTTRRRSSKGPAE